MSPREMWVQVRRALMGKGNPKDVLGIVGKPEITVRSGLLG